MSGNMHDSARRKIYNTRRWQRIRSIKFATTPMCEMCERKGLAVPAEDIHHITSFMSSADPATQRFLAFDYDNLMSLCKKCHQHIHNNFK